MSRALFNILEINFIGSGTRSLTRHFVYSPKGSRPIALLRRCYPSKVRGIPLTIPGSTPGLYLKKQISMAPGPGVEPGNLH